MPTVIERIQEAWDGEEPGTLTTTDDYAVDSAYQSGVGYRGADGPESLDNSGAGVFKDWADFHTVAEFEQYYDPGAMQLEAGGAALATLGRQWWVAGTSGDLNHSDITWLHMQLKWRKDNAPAEVGCPICS